MFDIYGVPPGEKAERKVTYRWTKASADAFAANLAGFGYRGVRVQADAAPQVVTPRATAPGKPAEVPRAKE